ncbi:MAG TPA: SIS domain-containing protein [Solirubrobacteraceae bacterium]|nr:SIS domain-containing protein [Solirubrobacteraceae bacterium]
MKGLGAQMEADMRAQPEVLRALASAERPDLGPPPEAIVIVARGSSDYAAIFGRYLLEAATGRPVALAAPSLQTLYGVESRLTGWLALGISQSGRTPEIATVLDRYRRAGARTLAITNDPDSPLARSADAAIALAAGDEGAVPATKTFTAQLAALALVAEALGSVPWTPADWSRVPGAVSEVLDDFAAAERAAARLDGADELVALGRGYLMPVALEAALKLREAARLRAEGWSAADFRHGPVTVAGARLPVLAVSASGPAAADVAELAGELESGGATVLRLADDPRVDLPYPGELAEPLSALPAAVRAQQLALALARRRGLDPDSPPGLRKVTPTR